MDTKRIFDLIQDKTCSICLETIIYQDSFITEPCVHIFHKNCIKSCKKSRCPLCNQKMTNLNPDSSTVSVLNATISSDPRPPISAKLLPTRTKLKGNDGRIWMVLLSEFKGKQWNASWY